MQGKVPRVLIVDDDERFLNATARVLRHGHHVTTARTATEALRVVSAERIDVAIIDYRLGDEERDGIALIREVKQVAPEVACVLYSAGAHTDLAVLAVKAGATDVVDKASDVRSILAKLAGARWRAASRPTLEAMKREYILKVLADVGGNKARAARELGMPRSTLHRELATWLPAPKR